MSQASLRPAAGQRRPARNQAISSSTTDTAAAPRRRIEDDSNWLDAVSSDEEDTTSDEEDGRHGNTSTQSGPSTAVPSVSTISASSSNLTLCSQYLEADRGRTEGRTRKPLISYVTNSWQNDGKGAGSDEKQRTNTKNPYYASYQAHKGYQPPRARGGRSPSPNCFDEMCDSGSLLDCLDVVWARTNVKALLVTILVLIGLYTTRNWFGHAAQKFAHSGALRSSVQLKLTGALPRGPKGRGRTWFGTQHSSDFASIVQVAGIRDEDWAWADGKRLIIVGDVHGCSEPLTRLLSETKFENGRDHLVFTGDLVSKGPDTAGVLDIARRYNASSVRGNHEDKLLLLRRDLNGPLKAMQTQSSEPLTGMEVNRKESELAESLTKDQMAYLEACPLILDLGELPGLVPAAFVAHAGLVPGVHIERQEPSAVMNMRSIDIRTHTPLRVHCPSTQRLIKADPASEFRDLPAPWDNKKSKVKVFDLDEKYVLPWTRLWEEWQTSVKGVERQLVIYGHDAPVGLVDGDWAVGIDTACVKGGKLTALVLEMKKGKVERRLQSVGCKDLRTDKARDKGKR